MLQKNNTLIKDDKEIANNFNKFFVTTSSLVNIIERSTSKKVDTSSKNESIENLILIYKDHPSIKSIKYLHFDKILCMPLAKERNIKKIPLPLNRKKV